VALIITGEIQNTQKWQYPLEAIREIVLNMIIHRDYRASSDSVVKVFDDKIEFYNPGKLPEDISIQNLIENNYKSTPRNKAIAEFFKNLGWIEKYGSGIGRIINYFKEANLPLPTFENHSGGFLVTVFARDKREQREKVGEKVGEKLSANQQEIIRYIAQNAHITAKELSIKLGISLRKAEQNLAKLKTLGKITRIGSDRGGYWEVKG